MNMVAKIRKLATKKGLTQAAVESAAELSANRISKWGSGKGEPTAKQTLRLARMFGVTMEYLADDAITEPSSDGLTEAERRLLWLAEVVGIEEATRRVAAATRVEQEAAYAALLLTAYLSLPRRWRWRWLDRAMRDLMR